MSDHFGPFQVPSGLIDEYGHVNYKHFPSLFEPAQDAFMKQRKIGFAEIEKAYGLRSVIKKCAVTYHYQLFEGKEVWVETTLRLGTTSLTYTQVMKDWMMGVAACVATLELVVVLIESDGKPCPIPEDLRALLS